MTDGRSCRRVFKAYMTAWSTRPGVYYKGDPHYDLDRLVVARTAKGCPQGAGRRTSSMADNLGIANA